MRRRNRHNNNVSMDDGVADMFMRIDTDEPNRRRPAVNPLPPEPRDPWLDFEPPLPNDDEVLGPEEMEQMAQFLDYMMLRGDLANQPDVERRVMAIQRRRAQPDVPPVEPPVVVVVPNPGGRVLGSRQRLGMSANVVRPADVRLVDGINVAAPNAVLVGVDRQPERDERPEAQVRQNPINVAAPNPGVVGRDRQLEQRDRPEAPVRGLIANIDPIPPITVRRSNPEVIGRERPAALELGGGLGIIDPMIPYNIWLRPHPGAIGQQRLVKRERPTAPPVSHLSLDHACREPVAADVGSVPLPLHGVIGRPQQHNRAVGHERPSSSLCAHRPSAVDRPPIVIRIPIPEVVLPSAVVPRRPIENVVHEQPPIRNWPHWPHVSYLIKTFQ